MGYDHKSVGRRQKLFASKAFSLSHSLCLILPAFRLYPHSKVLLNNINLFRMTGQVCWSVDNIGDNFVSYYKIEFLHHFNNPIIWNEQERPCSSVIYLTVV